MKIEDYMPSLLDREVSMKVKDAFGHRHFAQALRSLIESGAHEPPFSIGLLGGWGSGKSTIKALYVQELSDDESRLDGRTRRDRIQIVTFNAWRFGGDDIKRALLRHVFRELGGDDEVLKDHLFRVIQETHGRRKQFRDYLEETLKAWLLPLIPLLFLLILLALSLSVVLWILDVTDSWARAIVGATLTMAFTFLVKQVRSAPVSPYRAVTKIEVPSTTAEEYEDLLLKQLKDFKAGNTIELLVVFVDDLDRLSAEEMVQGLDAIRSFMEIPPDRLPEQLGLVFVISCDQDKVAAALARGRRQGDLPGSVFTRSDARRYLDRIFQFRLEIRPIPRQDLRQYALDRFEELPGIRADLEQRGVLRGLVDRIIHIDVQSPRNVLQIVNAFAEAWWIARKRETEELGTDRCGGLHEGAVTNHPLSLGALCALQVNFPDFYGDLQSEPDLIRRFTDVVVHGKKLEEQAASTQELLLTKYLQPTKTERLELRPESRSLRRFLSSLVGLRWPGSLRPLLYLSEDPVTRRLGDKAYRTWDSFVSGDTQGVLEILHREADAKQLSNDDCGLLHQMMEELSREPEVRQIGGARVLATLVNRLPTEYSHPIIGSLCRQLGESSDLRSRLGIDTLLQILSVALDDDRASIASRLIEDVLTLDGDMRFRLESLEPPNLEEGETITRHVVSLALDARKAHPLDPQANAQLLSWLQSRTVRANGKEHQLPFSDLETWIGEDENRLLKDFGQTYTTILGDELAAADGISFELDVAIHRARSVFDSLWSAGEETRPTLWKQLSRFAALPQSQAVIMSSHAFLEHATAVEPSFFSGFLQALSSRLLEDLKEGDGALVEQTSETLLDILRANPDALKSVAVTSLGELVDETSQHSESASLACSIVREVRVAKPDDAHSFVEKWIPRFLTNLPPVCTELLAHLFASLPEPIQSSIGAHLETIVSTENLDAAAATTYKNFGHSLPEEAWKTNTLQTHLTNLMPNIAARHQNPHDYLRKVFPVVAPVLRHAPAGPLGAMLQNLFTQAKAHPPHFAWLHAQMTKKWPLKAPELNPYDPQVIFDQAHQFVIAQTTNSIGIVDSMRDMVERDLVEDASRTNLTVSACAVWNHSPDEAADTLKSGHVTLTSDQAVSLLDAVDWDSDEHTALLLDVWTLVAQDADLEDRRLITNGVVKRGPMGPGTEPDKALRIWIDAQRDMCRETLGTAITQPDLEDALRRRLWAQAVQVGEVLGAEFFLETLPKLLVLQDIEETAAAVFQDQAKVSELLQSRDAQSDLSKRLIQGWHNASTKTIKGELAKWCKTLTGDPVLAHVDPNNLSDDDVTILKTHFSASKLKKITSKRKKSQGES